MTPDQHSSDRLNRRKLLQAIGTSGVTATLSVGNATADSTQIRDNEVLKLRREYNDLGVSYQSFSKYAPKVIDELLERDIVGPQEIEALPPVANVDNEHRVTIKTNTENKTIDDVNDVQFFAGKHHQTDGQNAGIIALLQAEIRARQKHVRIVIDVVKERGYAVVYKTKKVISPPRSEIEKYLARYSSTEIHANTDGIKRYVVDPSTDDITYTSSDCEVIDSWCNPNNVCTCGTIFGYSNYVEQTCCTDGDTTTCYPDIDECGCKRC